MAIRLLLKETPRHDNSYYVPDEFVEQILNANDTGQNMSEDYMLLRASAGTLVFGPK